MHAFLFFLGDDSSFPSPEAETWLVMTYGDRAIESDVTDWPVRLQFLYSEVFGRTKASRLRRNQTT
jgi:hypothetical protein